MTSTSYLVGGKVVKMADPVDEPTVVRVKLTAHEFDMIYTTRQYKAEVAATVEVVATDVDFDVGFIYVVVDE